MAEYAGGYKWAALRQQRELAEMGMGSNLDIAQGGWAVQREGIAAQLKLGMAQLKFQKQRMKKLEIPDLELRTRVAEHEMQMAEKIFQLNLAELELQTIQFEASLGGPDNWVQASNYARGVRDSNYAQFVKNLAEGKKGAAFGTPVEEAPDRRTMDSIAARLAAEGTPAAGGPGQAGAAGASGAPAGPSGPAPQGTSSGQAASAADSVQNNPTYQGVRSLLLGGGHRMGPGTVEDLDPTELQMMSSVAHDIGIGREGFMRWLSDYQNSRVGTENVNLA